MLEITLPYPPSVNHYKRVGRTITTKRGRIYQQRFDSDQTKRFYYEVWVKVRNLIVSEGVKSFQGATISLDLDLYPPDARKRDIDNVVKPTCDALQKGGLFENDFQIALLRVERKHIIPQGQIIVRIQEHDNVHRTEP